MDLRDIITRAAPPAPWAEGNRIPWNEPGFSERVLKEHLSQDHDMASRRRTLVDRHIQWIHDHILDGKASRILDLCCGPGLYGERLARLGHTYTGIDFSPASISYARSRANAEGLTAEYRHQDVREAAYGSNLDLAMLVFGEIYVFRPSD